MKNPIMYGAAWCGDCTRVKFFFKENNIAYEYHDIDEEAQYIDIVKVYSKGNATIPVIVFEDGSFLVEPSYEDLERKFMI